MRLGVKTIDSTDFNYAIRPFIFKIYYSLCHCFLRFLPLYLADKFVADGTKFFY